MTDRLPPRQSLVAALLLLLFAAGIVGLAWLLPRKPATVSPISTPTSAVRSNGLPSGGLSGGGSASQRPAGSPASAAAPALTPTGRPILQQVLAYGKGEAALGMDRVPEQEPIGPESFAVAKNGNILVADVAKHRLAIYSRDGEFLRAIPLPGVALGDVTTDGAGQIYVYDQMSRTLYQYDAGGTQRVALSLNPADIDTRGYFHVVGNSVFFADAAARDVQVGTLGENGELAADAAATGPSDGIHADSGRLYSLSLERGQSFQVVVNDGQGTPRAIAVPLPGVVSARFAGEDAAGRFYVQTERVNGGRIALEVVTFSAAGERLGVTSLPENDYAIWTTKLVDVRNDGTIVQFLPQKDQARLNLFAN
jgi:hypothetical protein